MPYRISDLDQIGETNTQDDIRLLVSKKDENGEYISYSMTPESLSKLVFKYAKDSGSESHDDLKELITEIINENPDMTGLNVDHPYFFPTYTSSMTLLSSDNGYQNLCAWADGNINTTPVSAGNIMLNTITAPKSVSLSSPALITITMPSITEDNNTTFVYISEKNAPKKPKPSGTETYCFPEARMRIFASNSPFTTQFVLDPKFEYGIESQYDSDHMDKLNIQSFEQTLYGTANSDGYILEKDSNPEHVQSDFSFTQLTYNGNGISSISTDGGPDNQYNDIGFVWYGYSTQNKGALKFFVETKKDSGTYMSIDDVGVSKCTTKTAWKNVSNVKYKSDSILISNDKRIMAAATVAPAVNSDMIEVGRTYNKMYIDPMPSDGSQFADVGYSVSATYDYKNLDRYTELTAACEVQKPVMNMANPTGIAIEYWQHSVVEDEDEDLFVAKVRHNSPYLGGNTNSTVRQEYSMLAPTISSSVEAAQDSRELRLHVNNVGKVAKINFAGTGVKTLALPQAVPPAGTVSATGFLSGANELTAVDLGGLSALGAGYFAGNSKLSSLALENVRRLDAKSLSGMAGLKTLAISRSLSSAAASSIYDMPVLSSLEWDCAITSTTANIISGCPALSVLKLSAATPKTNFKTIISAHPHELTVDYCGNTGMTYSQFPYNTTFKNDKLHSVRLKDVQQIPDYSFASAYALTSIEVPNTLSGLGQMSFAECTALTSFDAQNIVKIGSKCFLNCENISSLNLSNLKYATTSITASNTPTVCNGVQIFDGCDSLTALSIGLSSAALPAAFFHGVANNLTVTFTNIDAAGRGKLFPLSSTGDLSKLKYNLLSTANLSIAVKFKNNNAEYILSCNDTGKISYLYEPIQ